MDHIFSKKNLFWLILVAGLLAVVSVASLFVGGPSFRERDIDVKLEGPSQAISGDEVTYTLSYENKTKTTLKDIRIMFWYPKDSVVLNENGSISRPETESFKIDQLRPGQKDEKEIRAFLVGDRGNIKQARTRFAYYAGSFQSLFEKNIELNTTITSVPIPLTLVAPPQAVSGAEVTYILDYRNESPNPVSDLQFELTYPDGFQFIRANPQPGLNQRVWSVANLKNGSGSRIIVTGVLRGGPGDSKQVAATLKRKLGEQYIDYEKISATTVIANPFFLTTVLVNGSRDVIAHPGDRLSYTIRYENKSTFNLSGVQLKTTLSGEMFDYSTLQLEKGYFDQSSRTISWDAGAVNEFGNFNPNTKGEVRFDIKLKPNYLAGVGAANSFVKVSAKLSTENVPDSYSGNEISAEDSLTTKISTQPNLNQSLYYQDPAFGASGPFPPEVGKETSFTVHWQVHNPGNALTGAKISGILPTGVTWKNVYGHESGLADPTFSRNTSEVVWNIGVIPAGAKYELSFQVSGKPSTTQRGTAMVVLKNTKLIATDSVTSEPMVINGQDFLSTGTADRPDSGTVQ